ncbi:MAG: HRDC domain-containing protein [Gemmatimonadota bacterium]|nr:HRDC domain-containing protein [Gemmatimonadota bacterium]
MPYTLVRTDTQLEALARRMAGTQRLALDCEAAGFHRYSDALCLVQVTVEDETFLVDPFEVDAGPAMRGPLEDPDVEVVMHGADFDLRLLQRDVGITLRGLFDTQVAALLLGAPGLGLAALLESRLGVTLSKKYQRADWATRPLTDGMLEYAASDTRHLLELADLLSADLDDRGRSHWAEEECRAMEDASERRSPDGEVDPVTRVKGAAKLTPRQVAALRVALEWRDGVARERDRAVFRVVGDPPLLEAVLLHPRDARELSEVKGFPGGLARGGEGQDLLTRLRKVADLPEEELVGFPRIRNRGPGRPPPEVEELVDRLKGVRNACAEELGLQRGAFISNSVLQTMALRHPVTPEDLADVEGLRRWHREVAADRLLTVLRDAHPGS